MAAVDSLREAKQKLEQYCAYQERCHDEVISKMFALKLNQEERDTVITHLIAHHFLNEERFACSFARGKHRIKKWGKVRIVLELKQRHISRYNIDTALQQIDPDEYEATFHQVATQAWQHSTEKNTLKKRKKWCDYLLRKGWENQKVYEKLTELLHETDSETN